MRAWREDAALTWRLQGVIASVSHRDSRVRSVEKTSRLSWLIPGE